MFTSLIAAWVRPHLKHMPIVCTALLFSMTAQAWIQPADFKSTKKQLGAHVWRMKNHESKSTELITFSKRIG
jgi:hypothetical protein